MDTGNAPVLYITQCWEVVVSVLSVIGWQSVADAKSSTVNTTEWNGVGPFENSDRALVGFMTKQGK
jgi:hypothetical protein